MHMVVKIVITQNIRGEIWAYTVLRITGYALFPKYPAVMRIYYHLLSDSLCTGRECYWLTIAPYIFSLEVPLPICAKNYYQAMYIAFA